MGRKEELSEGQKLALDAIKKEEVKNHTAFIPDLEMAIAQSIPEGCLTDGVITFAVKAACMTGFGENITPENVWQAIQKTFCEEIENRRYLETSILRPFFIAGWSGQLEKAKFKPGAKYSYNPIAFWEQRVGESHEMVEKAWERLESLGIMKIVHDPNEVRRYWELNPRFFQAFKDGIDNRAYLSFLGEDEMCFVMNIFDSAASDE